MFQSIQHGSTFGRLLYAACLSARCCMTNANIATWLLVNTPPLHVPKIGHFLNMMTYPEYPRIAFRHHADIDDK